MYRVAIDVGGTHTDGIVVTDGGEIRMAKADTTPHELSEGVVTCCAKLGKMLGESQDEFFGKTELIIHGTTVGTNTVLQNQEPRVGSIVTRGFRDVVELRRGARDTLFNLKVPFPQPVSPRYLRTEVNERISYKGEVLEALDEDSCRRAVRLLRERGAESIAITYLFSFLNPDHERRTREIVLEEWPDAYVSLSSDVLPQIEEFERFSATLLDAYIAPSMGGYIKHLEKALARNGFTGRLLIGQANGSVATPEIVLNRPVWTISSGPAAAAPVALYLGEMFGTNNVISVDMGGTSFDMLLVVEGEAQVSTEEWVGSYRLAVPIVKVSSIGAGGGSIAWLDPTGVLQVGPKSAGSVPGPACYCKGGESATLTDADLLLGYLNPDNFLGGERILDIQKATAAIETHVSRKLGLSVRKAAGGIVQVTVHNSAAAIRRECIDRGVDPREFLMVAGGGAGPVHAALIAQELDIPRVVVPSVAPTYCAYGWLRSDIALDFVRSKVLPAEEKSLPILDQLYASMEAEASGILGDDVEMRRTVDARYYGQFRETEVEVPCGKLGAAELVKIEQAFHQRHERLFKFSVPEMELEFINYRIKAVLKTEKVKIPKLASTERPSGLASARQGERECVFGDTVVKAAIYLAENLRPGDTFPGPAIIEQEITTVVVPPSFSCSVDDYGNGVLTRI
ncbi:MAG: hydantoinase/oxoprolinase family protein [Desulfobacterales bacterium]|nr:hydantoinase/oxoprolinase family protein [Desulfobacterales bacterium]